MTIPAIGARGVDACGRAWIVVVRILVFAALIVLLVPGHGDVNDERDTGRAAFDIE